MQRSTILAGILAAMGVACALVVLRPWNPRRESPPATRNLLAELAKQASQDLKAAKLSQSPGGDPAAIAETVAALRDSLRSHITLFPIELDLTNRDVDAIIQLACERVRLLLDPDYNAYVDHVHRLTGLPKGSAKLRERLMSREAWDQYAARFVDCSIDPEKAEAYATYRGGHPLSASIHAGHNLTAQHQTHPFIELHLTPQGLDRPADVVDVVVPIQTTDSITNDPIPVFFVVRMARLSPTSPWVPWQIVLNIPSDEGYALPPPL